MRRRGEIPSFMLLAAVVLALALLQGCRFFEVGHRFEARRIRLIKDPAVVDGYLPASLPSSGRLAFQRDTEEAEPWIYSVENGRAQPLFPGRSPTLSSAGMFYLGGGEHNRVYCFRPGDKPRPLGLNYRPTSIYASPSGRRLLLLRITHQEEHAEVSLYDVNKRSLRRLRYAKSYFPDNPFWISEDQILLDASEGTYDGYRSIYSARIPAHSSWLWFDYVLPNRFLPALSPDSRLLACRGYGQRDISFLDFGTHEEIGRISPPQSNQRDWFDAPVAWLSETRLAVDYYSDKECVPQIWAFEISYRP